MSTREKFYDDVEDATRGDFIHHGFSWIWFRIGDDVMKCHKTLTRANTASKKWESKQFSFMLSSDVVNVRWWRALALTAVNQSQSRSSLALLIMSNDYRNVIYLWFLKIINELLPHRLNWRVFGWKLDLQNCKFVRLFKNRTDRICLSHFVSPITDWSLP